MAWSGVFALVLPAALAIAQEDAETPTWEQTQGRAYRSFLAGAERPAPSTFPGVFRQPPVPHWSARLPGGRLNAATHTERARPVVDGSSIFVGSASGDALYEVSRTNGTVIREFPAASSVESEPILAGNLILFADTGGVTWAYERDGSLRWRHDSAAPVLVRPTLDEGRGTLYITNVDDLVVALDATTGELQWQHQQKPDLSRRTALSLYGAPPAVLLDGEVLVGFSDGSIVGLEAETGEVAWQQRVGEGAYPDVIAEPAVLKDVILSSGYFEPLVALEREDRTVRWRMPYGAAAGSTLVTVPSGETWLLHPGTDGVLRAIETANGLVVWSWGEDREQGALSRPTIAGDHVLIGDAEGTVTMLQLTDGQEVWSHEPRYHLSGVTVAPTVDGRQLVFVTNAGFLVSMLSPQ